MAIVSNEIRHAISTLKTQQVIRDMAADVMHLPAGTREGWDFMCKAHRAYTECTSPDEWPTGLKIGSPAMAINELIAEYDDAQS